MPFALDQEPVGGTSKAQNGGTAQRRRSFGAAVDEFGRAGEA